MTEFLAEALERELDCGMKELVIIFQHFCSKSSFGLVTISLYVLFAGCLLSREVPVFFIPEIVYS